MSARSRVDARPATPPAPPLIPVRPRGVEILAIAIAAICVALSVSNRITDYDVWEHIAVGRTIWSLHAVPTVYLWTWPSYGDQAVVPSWLFRALIWPVWSVAGVTGLFAWRWITTLLAFGIAWSTARRMGASGVALLVPIVMCAMVYRERSEVRPETLVAVLLALEIWILETRRNGGLDRTPWIVPLAWVWANAHISYHLCFLLLAIFGADAWLESRSRRTDAAWRSATRLWVVTLAALVVIFLNPYGWRALASPFQYFLHWRHEPLFQAIAELQPPDWRNYVRSGAPLLLVAWPALAIVRMRRRGFDRVEAALIVCFTAFTLMAQRFLGFYAIVAAPYFARDLAHLVGSWPMAKRMPPAARSLAAAAACVAVAIPELTHPQFPLGIGFDMTKYPVAACEFMAGHGVQGRGFTTFHLGGYMIHRFWPDRGRLPFMDAHQEIASLRDRRLYIDAQSRLDAWRELDRIYRFDYALLARPQPAGHHLLDFLDADSTWALVFLEDDAALYVRTDGPLAAVAKDFRYRWVPGGAERLEALRARCLTDSSACDSIVSELSRAVESATANANAHSLLANVALMRGRWAEARDHLERALAVDRFAPRAHERLGLIALEEGRAADALREFRAERSRNGPRAGLDFAIGRAEQRLGDLGAARASYRRELRRNPAHAGALDSLRALEEMSGR